MGKEKYWFRGKPKDGGEWVYGFYYLENDVTYIITRQGKRVEVFYESVGQFTGFTAGGGTAVFEGDIVKYGINEKRNYLVVYLRMDAGYFLSDSLNWCPCQIRGTPLGNKNSHYMKVIGNVFDNKNLLPLLGDDEEEKGGNEENGETNRE